MWDEVGSAARKPPLDNVARPVVGFQEVACPMCRLVILIASCWTAVTCPCGQMLALSKATTAQDVVS